MRAHDGRLQPDVRYIRVRGGTYQHILTGAYRQLKQQTRRDDQTRVTKGETCWSLASLAARNDAARRLPLKTSSLSKEQLRSISSSGQRRPSCHHLRADDSPDRRDAARSVTGRAERRGKRLISGFRLLQRYSPLPNRCSNRLLLTWLASSPLSHFFHARVFATKHLPSQTFLFKQRAGTMR